VHPVSPVDDDPFAGKAEWFDRAYRETSHGLVRLELVLERLLEWLPPPPAAVLDVGGGTGAFALPLAARGYEVTLIDRSAEWLEVAARTAEAEGVSLRGLEGAADDVLELAGGAVFDAILVHTLLLYLDDPTVLLRDLRRVAGPNAVLSVLEKNREGLAMRPGLAGEYDEAIRVLDDPMASGRLGIVNRARSQAELRALLLQSGWLAFDRAGVRLFADGMHSFDPDVHPRLLSLERAAGTRDPYRRVARMVHVLARPLPDPPESLEMIQARSYARASAGTRSAWPPEQAMSGPELFAFLDEPRYATISTGRPDGRPHAIPAAFRHRDGRLWLPTEAGAVRLRNVELEPSVSVVVSEGARGEHSLVIVEGEGIVHEDPGPVLDEWLREDWRRAHGTELDWASRIIEVVPTKVFSYVATERT
jgi:S-adenosylmethionine-dependent methyltransferase